MKTKIRIAEKKENKIDWLIDSGVDTEAAVVPTLFAGSESESN
jgi:hypothetical protein